MKTEFVYMNRRSFLNASTLAVAATAATGCGLPQAEVVEAGSDLPAVTWQMATSWTPSVDTIYRSAVDFTKRVAALTRGRFQIQTRAAGELVPGLEVMSAVEQGGVEAGHTASYYYIGKSPVAAFGTALPFGLTARQNVAWFYQAGGLEMLQAFYADRFGIIQFPAGSTGTQMGGWFNRELESVKDLAGLKMRIPGLGGRVMDRLGVLVQVLPGGEIYQALVTGAIDAAEWIGPHEDMLMGFHLAAGNYYYPGWWEPGATVEVQINLKAWNELPPQYQAAVRAAAVGANLNAVANSDVLNIAALAELRRTDVNLRPFPIDIVQTAEVEAFAIYEEMAAQDADFAEVFRHWNDFRISIREWHGVAESAFLNYRSVL